jgi:hypothetical protein
MGLLRRLRGEPPPVPEWASFFTADEYATCPPDEFVALLYARGSLRRAAGSLRWRAAPPPPAASLGAVAPEATKRVGRHRSHRPGPVASRSGADRRLPGDG